MSEHDQLPALTVAPGAVRHIAYCRTCGKQISAETARENGGHCHAHANAAVGVRWSRSDDYRP